MPFAETAEQARERRQRIVATGFWPGGSHYDGSCETFACPDCGALLHLGRLQMPDELEEHARRHSTAAKR